VVQHLVLQFWCVDYNCNILFNSSLTTAEAGAQRCLFTLVSSHLTISMRRSAKAVQAFLIRHSAIPSTSSGSPIEVKTYGKLYYPNKGESFLVQAPPAGAQWAQYSLKATLSAIPLH
jgi:hypothetical protein